MPTATELRELEDDELDTRLTEYRRELLNLRFQLATGQLDGILRDGIRQLMAKSAAFDPNQAAASLSTGEANEHYNWKARLGNGKTLDQEFVGVTHSLGAYLFFNALNPDTPSATWPGQSTATADEDAAVRYIFERTSLVYFLANQIQMLEITNLEITLVISSSGTIFACFAYNSSWTTKSKPISRRCSTAPSSSLTQANL